MVIFQNKKLWCLLMAMLWCSQSLLAATIKVQSDRNPVAMNESFRLVFEADGSVDDDPDFKALEQDFEVMQQSQGTTMQIVNGQVSQARQWTVVLMPRRSGQLTIPAIAFGKDKSQPVVIGVTKAAVSSEEPNNSVLFFEVSTTSAPETGAAYVQSQVIYKARLFRAVNVANARLSEPVVSGADVVVEKLGDDREFETTRDGRRYVVLERSYAIFPQQSGTVTIDPVTFEGQVVNRARGMFDVFDQGGPIRRVRSESVTVDVMPMPAGEDSQQWLPAREVKLIEEWPEGVDLSQPMTAGEPLTWTLTLIADGLTAAQLPTITPVMPDGLKAYPDQAKQMNDKKQETLIGVRQEKIALIPIQAGEYQLPAIDIPWWNSQTGQREVAHLPARTLRVVAAAGSNRITAGQNSVSESGRVPSPVTAATAASSLSGTNYTWQIVSALLAMGWLMTVVAWLASRRTIEPQHTSELAPLTMNFSVAKSRVKKACLGNYALTAKSALLAWGGGCWPGQPPSTLGQLAQRVTDESLRAQIVALNQYLYGRATVGTADKWDGKVMWQVFERALVQPKAASARQESTLSPMYY